MLTIREIRMDDRLMPLEASSCSRRSVARVFKQLNITLKPERAPFLRRRQRTLGINMSVKYRQIGMDCKEKQKALASLCDTTHWRAVVALTLNVKQSVPTQDGSFVLVDEQACKKAFKRFCNSINREIYRAAHRHHGKCLRIVPILEHSSSGRWHYHVAIEPPEFMDGEALAGLAIKRWEKTALGYGHGQVCAQADSGWLHYMTKFRTKEVFEDFLDCLDVEALHNPIASA